MEQCDLEKIGVEKVRLSVMTRRLNKTDSLKAQAWLEKADPLSQADIKNGTPVVELLASSVSVSLLVKSVLLSTVAIILVIRIF